MRTLHADQEKGRGIKMPRTKRIALLAAIALILAVSGTVLATRAPNSPAQPAQNAQDGEDTPPTAEDLAHAESRLEDALGSDVDPAVLSELATQYGLGGAVRILAWSSETGTDMATIRGMRDGDGTEGSGMGWGQIAKDLGVHPGIGSIMGNGGGQGRENAPGQNRDEGDASGG